MTHACASRRIDKPGGSRKTVGFTLIEVLVALAIVAIALLAGLKATTALTNNAVRSSDVLQAQICAENELIKLRLARQFPGVGDITAVCEQGGREFQVVLLVRPTPNPLFRRVDAQVRDADSMILQLSTVVTRY
ncbi:MAG: type II secretion system minor pseudopilin GspI [Polaromonas sp.]|nr:type II secretion system minor pseudopilin GspI [Polaromonas sp.]